MFLTIILKNKVWSQSSITSLVGLAPHLTGAHEGSTHTYHLALICRWRTVPAPRRGRTAGRRHRMNNRMADHPLWQHLPEAGRVHCNDFSSFHGVVLWPVWTDVWIPLQIRLQESTASHSFIHRRVMADRQPAERRRGFVTCSPCGPSPGASSCSPGGSPRWPDPSGRSESRPAAAPSSLPTSRLSKLLSREERRLFHGSR